MAQTDPPLHRISGRQRCCGRKARTAGQPEVNANYEQLHVLQWFQKNI